MRILHTFFMRKTVALAVTCVLTACSTLPPYAKPEVAAESDLCARQNSRILNEHRDDHKPEQRCVLDCEEQVTLDRSAVVSLNVEPAGAERQADEHEVGSQHGEPESPADVSIQTFDGNHVGLLDP